MDNGVSKHWKIQMLKQSHDVSPINLIQLWKLIDLYKDITQLLEANNVELNSYLHYFINLLTNRVRVRNRISGELT